MDRALFSQTRIHPSSFASLVPPNIIERVYLACRGLGRGEGDEGVYLACRGLGRREGEAIFLPAVVQTIGAIIDINHCQLWLGVL